MLKTITKAIVITLIICSCKNSASENTEAQQEKEKIAVAETKNDKPFFKLSLAQWSLHKEILSGKMNPLDFAQKAKELGFEGVEYVNHLYSKELEKNPNPEIGMRQLLETLKSKSEEHQIQNLIIMVDGEGDLAVTNEKERNQAVQNHKKWVDAAQFLGCHSIRVNLFGTNNPKEWVEVAVDGLGKLSTYAATKNINVIVENHGYLSSNAALLIEVIKKVNKPNCGTLPDFGNFCLEREGGKRWEAKCIKEYDKYKGVEEMMPYAKAVSAKSYDFNAEGNETKIDYKKMLEIVKKAKYNGFIGVEYEGERLGEIEGIKATRDLLLNTAKQIQ
ncbi:sugar phosphate isomerase/epimerase family protein [Aquimarina sp. MMG016]|uniref:sugar phosphate isomerase/epimerase family protein n=1 Tax=Aquimarina sp. MMG016 TaxID=2822690 RepID=UPI001B3A2445|nr:sugar phosphate isomerase/epimerase family protein [Aquimarina sp. MMG016]MBQ4821696.1 sugar phosphate isomerase/epimerase [Aquimarina sp. MMG016]